jgi:hypothetical protein
MNMFYLKFKFNLHVTISIELFEFMDLCVLTI